MKYLWKCDECGYVVSMTLKAEDYDQLAPSDLLCPFCGEDALSRVYQSIPVFYNAKGFYVTGD